MPSDFTIRLSGSAPPVAPADVPEHAADNTRPDNTKNTPVGSALAAVVPVNATLALDPQAGVVVIEFRNEAGDVVSSIPTAQQLTAYRDGASSQAAPAPAPAPSKNGERTP